ncbi:hypothetical protein V6N13_013084 [Hibiscus sabdariffa]
MWSKVTVKASFTNEVEWWTNPAGCLRSVVSSYPLLDSCSACRRVFWDRHYRSQSGARSVKFSKVDKKLRGGSRN